MILTMRVPVAKKQPLIAPHRSPKPGIVVSRDPIFFSDSMDDVSDWFDQFH